MGDAFRTGYFWPSGASDRKRTGNFVSAQTRATRFAPGIFPQCAYYPVRNASQILRRKKERKKEGSKEVRKEERIALRLAQRLGIARFARSPRKGSALRAARRFAPRWVSLPGRRKGLRYTPRMKASPSRLGTIPSTKHPGSDTSHFNQTPRPRHPQDSAGSLTGWHLGTCRTHTATKHPAPASGDPRSPESSAWIRRQSATVQATKSTS